MPPVLRTIGWGIYCACSWTWCIGMFLPVIMLERYGWLGFLVFAVPNVIGCTAFGYVVKKRPEGEGTKGLPSGPASLSPAVSSHHTAVLWFSIITIAYHVFFIAFMAWMLTPVMVEDRLRLAIIAPLALLAVSALLSGLPDRAWLPFAAIVYAFSLATFALIGTAPLAQIPLAVEGTLIGADGLLWLAPAIALGFLLCPYLDATFHRALRSSPSRHAFAIFGMTFAVMIVLTATYWDALTTGLSWIILAHITAQSIFTMAAHQRELREQASTDQQVNRATDQQVDTSTVMSLRGAGRGAPVLALLLAPVLALPLAFIGHGVDMYLRFLVFYGLVFPAYVLLFVTPLRVLMPVRHALPVFAVMVLALAPFYEAAFIHAWTWLGLVPPTALLIWSVAAAARRSK